MIILFIDVFLSKSIPPLWEKLIIKLISLLIIETTVPNLLNLYLSIDRDDKFENLIKTIFNNNANSLNKKDLETLNKNLWNQQWYTPLLTFYLKQNNQHR